MQYNPKNICIITSVHSATDKRIYNKEALTLLKAGYEIDIIAPIVTDLKVEERINIICIPRLKKIYRPLNWYLILKKALKKKYFVYHFHDPDLLIVAVILRIITSRPVIYDVHEHYPDRIFINKDYPNFITLPVKRIIEFIEDVFSKIIKNIIVVEEEQKRRFEKINLNVLLLYNFAKRSDFREPNVNYQQKTIIHTGTLSRIRGSLILADVVKAVTTKRSDIKFLFVNRFLSEYERAILTNKIKTENIADKFRFIDAIASDKIQEIIEMGDIAVSILQPVGQYQKAIPTKFFEYMACAIPILAERSRYSKIFIQNSGCGLLFQWGDVDEIVNKIIYLSDHPEEKARLGRNSYKAFMTKYNWESQIGDFLKYYQNLR